MKEIFNSKIKTFWQNKIPSKWHDIFSLIIYMVISLTVYAIITKISKDHPSFFNDLFVSLIELIAKMMGKNL